MRLTLSLLWALLLVITPQLLFASASPLDLDTGWEYRWGDSPLQTDGTPAWTQEDAPEAWQAIDFPSNPPGREDENAWFRITLPSGEWRDPVLYIYSVDLIVQVYMESELIYQYGHFDEGGKGRFEGWPWHMISLPEDFAGKTLYFRIFSDYTDIGLWGEVKLMDRPDLWQYILAGSAIDLVISAFSLLLALLAGVFALMHTRRRSFAGISLFSLASGIMILAETQASQLLLNLPLLWDYLAAAGYYALPIGIGLLLEHWFDSRHSRWIRLLWQLHFTYLVVALSLALSGVINLSSTFPVYDALLAITLPSLFAIIAMRLNALNGEQRWIIASYGLFGLLLLIDMAVAHGLLPWARVPVSVGALAFSLTIVAISLRHYSRTQTELVRLNQRLEQQVEERTRALQEMVEKLLAYSYQDPLTGLKNRRHFDEIFEQEAAIARRGKSVTLVMLDIDHFKHFNDLHGHEAGDAVLMSMGKMLSDYFRDADAVCRLGGEEFVVIMPGATSTEATERIGQFLISMRDQRFVHEGKELGRVSLSCGIATYPDHSDDPVELLRLADQALYRAKRCGRDRLETYSSP